ncbi:MAG: hypothetical protein ACYCSO_10115 [Cuniculiplasma sp.]
MIDISVVKKATLNLPDAVRELITEEKSKMDIEEFLANVKVWEKQLKKEEKP